MQDAVHSKSIARKNDIWDVIDYDAAVGQAKYYFPTILL